MVETSLSNEHENASFLAASAPHSGDWLLALPITNCGNRLDDEADRTAVALRLARLSVSLTHAMQSSC